MADEYGYAIVAIYVVSVPPFDPKRYVTAITSSAVSFTWDRVADRGDGAGSDYFVSGLDHYVSWLTAGDRRGRLQLATTSMPRIVSLAGMAPGESACVHVEALARAPNPTPPQASPAPPPLSPPPPPRHPPRAT